MTVSITFDCVPTSVIALVAVIATVMVSLSKRPGAENPPSVKGVPSYVFVAYFAVTVIGFGVIVRTPGTYSILLPKTAKPKPVRFVSTIPYVPTGAVIRSFTTTPEEFVKVTVMSDTASVPLVTAMERIYSGRGIVNSTP